MKKNILCLLFVAGFAGMSSAQNDKPGWLTNKPKAGNSTYVYVVERASGTTVSEAVNNALVKVLRTTMMRIGAVVSWDEVNNALQQGADWGTVAMKYNIPVNKVCEWQTQSVTSNKVILYVLWQVAAAGNIEPRFEEFNKCR